MTLWFTSKKHLPKCHQWSPFSLQWLVWECEKVESRWTREGAQSSGGVWDVKEYWSVCRICLSKPDVPAVRRAPRSKVQRPLSRHILPYRGKGLPAALSQPKWVGSCLRPGDKKMYKRPNRLMSYQMFSDVSQILIHMAAACCCWLMFDSRPSR